MDRILTTEQLIKELEKYNYKQLHLHHTWKPAHSDFKGNNHLALQQSMREHHIKVNGWSDIGQHLTLMPDGLWVTGRPFDKTPASITGWNTGSLAVEMLGNFDKVGELPYNNLGYNKLEGKQKESILELMKWFGEKFGYDKEKFHREGPAVFKSCPGTSLDKATLIKEAKALNKVTEQKAEDPRVDLPVVIHGKEITLKSIKYDNTNHIPIRTLELLGYKVDFVNGKVTIEYNGGAK